MKRERLPPSSKKKLVFKLTFGVILLLILGAGLYGLSVYKSVTSTLSKTHEPLKRPEANQRVINLSEGDPISILLLGVDQREGDRGRPDSLILLTANPEDESIKMLSIPRDTYTEIVGQETKDKINHSYTYGGIDTTIKSIENFLEVPIDYYVEVNMDGFKDLVDAVGGLSLDNNLEFSDNGTDFPLGQLTLNGEEALTFARMRSSDPNGDLGRQERQRNIIQAFIKEAVQLETLTNYGSILEVIGDNVKTNLTFDDMKKIQKNYSNTRHNIDQIEISGSGKKEKGVYYYIVPEEERIEQLEMLREHLGLE